MSHFRFPVRQLPVAWQDFANEVENIVDRVLNTNECNGNGCAEKKEGATFLPAMDVVESESQYDLYLDLPGVTPDQIKVDMHEDRLQVSGTRTTLPTQEGVTHHRAERVAGTFHRSIRMPKLVDADKIDAQFENGVLHIILPKQTKPAPKTIQVRTV